MKTGRAFFGVVGASLLLLVTTAVPSQAAPTPTLGGKLCKSWGGTWESGKFTRCTVTAAFLNTDFIIKATSALVINGIVTIGGTVTNNGDIYTNYGTLNIYNSGQIINSSSGTISGYGTINNNSGTIFNYGTISYRGTINNSGNIYNYYALINSGTISNYAYIYNYEAITNNNSGTITNYAYIANYDTITNFGTMYNCDGIYSGNEPVPNGFSVCP